MPDASWAVGNFAGGEISQFAQGRFDKPDYRISLKVCLNAFPVEIGPWVRRPGTQYASHARGGAQGRTIRFDFEQSAPISTEWTNGFVRFRNGTTLITTNDAQVVLAVSSANPAVAHTTAAVTWATGDTLIFPGASTPLLENRQFVATKVDTTHFSLADAITGANIDGSTLGALVAGATVAKVHELSTVYIGGSWSSIRAVQAETTSILLNGGVAPQALTVSSLPSAIANPVFAIGAATFNDGPYLDPPTNGALLTPNQKTGIVTLTLSFPAYDATRAYAKGSFVTSSSVNYVSLIDQNVGNTPASSPSDWATTSAGVAINNGLGFISTDIGRLIRMFSEPPAWAVGTTYSVGQVVSYNPSGVPGAATYWQSLTGTNTGNNPGSDITHWQIIPQGAAIWTWGKITSLASQIPSAPSGVAYIGNMTSGGGLAAAFDGVINKSTPFSAARVQSGISSNSFTVISYVGENFGGASPANYAIASATIFPSTDFGFCQIAATGGPTNNFEAFITVTALLYGANSPPASATSGTLLGSTLIGDLTMDNQEPLAFTVGNAAVNILSVDQVTTYQYIWVVLQVGVTNPQTVQFVVTSVTAQVQFLGGTTSAIASVAANVELLGPALLYTAPIQTWRLGVYSGTTGYPTCGVYNDGRLYLGGAVGNRFDACVANGMVGGTINFAPTDQYGVVSAASAISYTFNSKGVNQILWMKPDLQGVKAGTQAGEWLVQAPTAGSISPLNITARQVTSHGSANIEPIDTEHTLIFVQRFARKLLEYFPDVFSGKFSAPNLADKTVRTRAGIAELAYTSAVTPVIWGRDALGALFGITYKRDSLASSQPPTFYAWHGHALGSGRTVESITAGPSVGGNLDALTMVTNDPSTNVRHVEVLTDTQDEQSALASAWFLDDAVNPTSTSSTATTFTVNGLWHLNGKMVQVFAGGLDLGDPGEGKPFADFVVANGSLTITFGDGISAGAGRGLFTAAFAASLPLSQIVVGFTYNSDGQLVRPMTQADSGARNGPAFAKLSRGHRYGLKLVGTLGLSVGGDLTKTLYPCAFKQADGVTNLTALTTFSGIHQDSLRDDYGYEGGSPAWRVSRPFPANVVIVGSNLASQDQ